MLFIFVMGLVIASFALTTAMLSVFDVETAERRIKTVQKMQLSMHEVGGRDFQIDSETGGADISFINEEDRVPLNMTDFVNNGYLYNFGMSSSSYNAEDDAYGDALSMTRASGVFTIASSNISETLTLSEALYVSNDIAVLVHDLTNSSQPPTTQYVGDGLSNMYISLSGGTRSGIYDINGSRIATFNYGGAVQGLFTALNLSVGCYELRFFESTAATGGVTWMQNGMGTNVVSCFIIVYPGSSTATTYTKFIRLPIDVI